jgi:purine catabolism regulator
MSPSTSLAIVSNAVAGDGLERVARSASEALGHPVAVICPVDGTPMVWPAEAVPAARLDELAAAAAAIVRLMGEGLVDASEVVSRRALIGALRDGPPADVSALVGEGRRLGVDLAGGAVAICARGPGVGEALSDHGALAAMVGPDCAIGLVPVADEPAAVSAAERLREAGLEVGVSAPRRQPALLHEAVREAMLLASVPDASVAGQEDTYRLLIGVLLRDRDELEQLRAATVSPIVAYDAEHDTELLATLATFLTHHGSTTETAEALRLHRHTVGYRLSRVQEVSGLSPYESDGRERLSLGLKAAQILAADERLSESRIGSRLSRL